MNKTVALRLLGEIMNWPDDRAAEEYRWLGFMAKLKYDGYRDFVAGARFLESLAGWLRQFAEPDRETAYALLKEQLIYFGPIEMKRLVEAFYPEAVHPWLVEEVSRRQGTADWLVGRKHPEEMKKLLRQTLFVALSEGAHTDAIRHANPELSNEQIIVSHQVGHEKWHELVAELRKATGDPKALFVRAFLIDDFTASGTTLIRREADGRWKGKIPKFLSEVHRVAEGGQVFEDGWTLGAHHYLSTHQASTTSKALLSEYISTADSGPPWIELSYGYLLPSSTKLTVDTPPLKHLIDTYYDPAIETEHNKAGGGTSGDIRAGYKSCALAVVLDHNTPNNSLPILWAESQEGGPHAMRPLFRRRQRHT